MLYPTELQAHLNFQFSSEGFLLTNDRGKHLLLPEEVPRAETRGTELQAQNRMFCTGAIPNKRRMHNLSIFQHQGAGAKSACSPCPLRGGLRTRLATASSAPDNFLLWFDKLTIHPEQAKRVEGLCRKKLSGR